MGFAGSVEMEALARNKDPVSSSSIGYSSSSSGSSIKLEAILDVLEESAYCTFAM